MLYLAMSASLHFPFAPLALCCVENGDRRISSIKSDADPRFWEPRNGDNALPLSIAIPDSAEKHWRVSSLHFPIQIQTSPPIRATTIRLANAAVWDAASGGELWSICSTSAREWSQITRIRSADFAAGGCETRSAGEHHTASTADRRSSLHRPRRPRRQKGGAVCYPICQWRNHHIEQQIEPHSPFAL